LKGRDPNPDKTGDENRLFFCRPFLEGEQKLFIRLRFVYNKTMDGLIGKERIDDLQWGGLRIIQTPELFCFGTDSVLLAGFVRVGREDTVADLGCGSGVLSILIGGKNPGCRVYAVEIQEESAQMAQRSVLLNGLENVTIVHDDLKNAHKIFPRCNVVVSNPPYDRIGAGKVPGSESRRIARQEVMADFGDIARSAARLLGDGGRFYFIHRAERLAEVIATLKGARVEPKTARFIHTRMRDKAKLVLFCAQKNAGEGMEILPPLVILDNDGAYTPEVRKLCGTEEKDG